MAIYFEQPSTPLLHDEVKLLVVLHLKAIDVAFSNDLIYSIKIICLGVKQGGRKGVWVGITKLHLLKPEVDVIGLLKGLRHCILVFHGSYDCNGL